MALPYWFKSTYVRHNPIVWDSVAEEYEWDEGYPDQWGDHHGPLGLARVLGPLDASRQGPAQVVTHVEHQETGHRGEVDVTPAAALQMKWILKFYLKICSPGTSGRVRYMWLCPCCSLYRAQT